MRIALLIPSYWPEVRRGSERLVHDLGVELVARGHDVTILTSHRGRDTSGREDGMRVVRSRRLPEWPPLRSYEHHITNAPNVIRRLVKSRFDVAHAFFPIDAWAALLVRDRLRGPPVVFSLHGIPTRAFLVKRRYRLEIMDRAINGADAASGLSAAAAEAMETYFGRPVEVLPGGAITRDFAMPEPRSERPTLICAASLGDPRKRAELLFAAFERLRERRPEASLLCVRTRDPILSGVLRALPEGAEWVDGDDTGELARLYARSWASVLPAVEEAFGLVLVESLAAGTPVVAARSGACPEIVVDEALGRLFDADDQESLALAMDEALALASADTTREACRQAAAAWDWRVVGDRYERVYEDVLRRDARGRRRGGRRFRP